MPEALTDHVRRRRPRLGGELVVGGELLEHRRRTSRARRGLTPLDPKVIRRIHPGELGGAEYIAVCVPAFSMDTVHRDPE